MLNAKIYILGFWNLLDCGGLVAIVIWIGLALRGRVYAAYASLAVGNVFFCFKFLYYLSIVQELGYY